MHSLTHLGANFRNENLLTAERAEAFRRMIAANPRFTDAIVQEAPLAKGSKRFFVAYKPATLERQLEMLQEQADVRAARAAEQADEYQLWADPDTTGLYWVLNLGTQEVYEATVTDCNCPDFFFRGRHVGVPCKHQHYVRAEVEAGALTSQREADRSARLRRMMDDFPLD